MHNIKSTLKRGEITNLAVITTSSNMVALFLSPSLLAKWDEFFDEIQTVCANVPYMVCIGNHERNWFDNA